MNYIFTHCKLRMGDNLAHLLFLRKVAKANPDKHFVHAANQAYLPQLIEVVSDVTNISLCDVESSVVPIHSVDVWKNHRDFWVNHPDKNDYVRFYLDFYEKIADKMMVDNPIKSGDDFFFDYPALSRKTSITEEFDVLVVNSPPMSGQFKGYRDMSELIEMLARKLKVVCTHPVRSPEIACTLKLGMTVSQIGSLSTQCNKILMVATGPCWPTFNVWNKFKIKERVILSDNEKVDISPNTVHFQSITEAFRHCEGWQ